MSIDRLYPDCDYFNEERDSESAPQFGEGIYCYRYGICNEAKEKEDKNYDTNYSCKN